MAKTKYPKLNLGKLLSYTNLAGGLVLFCVGLGLSSRPYVGGVGALFFCIPGLGIFAISLFCLRSNSSLRKSYAVLTISTVYLVVICILALVSWYHDYRTTNYYAKLYNDSKVGMSYEDVLRIAGGRQGTCKPYLLDKSDMDCVWIDAVYAPGGSIVSGGNNYVEIVFNSAGSVISKNASGH